MPRSVKAFATHDSFVSNNPKAINTFGELSTYSRTYEKDTTLYTHNTDKSITVEVFHSTNDQGALCAINPADLELASAVAKTIYDYTTSRAREIYRDELRTHLLETHRAKAQAFDLGEVVESGGYYCVQWAKWRDLKNNEFQVWFSDASFRAEYDEFEIEIIMPVENPDVFFSSRTVVEQELAKRPVDVLTRLAQAAKRNSPETVFRLDIFPWHNPTSKVAEVDTNWYVLIWGDAGDNIDSVKERIQETILARSSHTRDEWKQIFPDIFKRNEFIIVPQWDVFSNENKVKQQASLYSPFMDYSESISKYGTPFMRELAARHIQTHGQFMGLYYRAISGFVCGSAENRDNKFKLRDVFPDYMDVSSTSTDFNYQSVETQNWSIRLQEMLAVAEEMTPTSMLPRDKITTGTGEVIPGEKIFTRVIRDGKLFVVFKFGHFHYLMAAKYNFLPRT